MYTSDVRQSKLDPFVRTGEEPRMNVRHQQFYKSADRAFCRIVPKTYQKPVENVLDMLEKTSLGRIQSVLYVLYVLKPAKRADFSMIGRFVNFLMGTKRNVTLYTRCRSRAS